MHSIDNFQASIPYCRSILLQDGVQSMSLNENCTKGAGRRRRIKGDDVADERMGDVQMRGATAGVVPRMSDVRTRERTAGVVSQVDNM